MLYRASVIELKRGSLSRRYSHTVVAMRYYPRFLTKAMVDEYVHALAPDRALFTEFKAKDRALKDHDRAFEEVGYEARFTVSAQGAEALGRLTELASTKDVFLLCQCQALERCHADLLLLLSRHWFGGQTQHVRVKYPVFEARLARGEMPIPQRSE